MRLRTKRFFKVGIVCLLVVIVIATYLWYLYFGTYEGKVLSKNVRLEIINNGRINYINAVPEDDPSIIPVYYFRVKNNVDSEISYDILLKDVAANMVNDGCVDAAMFKRNELVYELKLDNRVVKSGKLDSLSNDILYSNKMNKGVDSYSLKVWLDDGVESSIGRHYHYVVNVEEK